MTIAPAAFEDVPEKRSYKIFKQAGVASLGRVSSLWNFMGVIIFKGYEARRMREIGHRTAPAVLGLKYTLSFEYVHYICLQN